MNPRQRLPDQGKSGSLVQVVLSLGRGGLETLAVDLASGLKDRGFRPLIVAVDDGGPLEERLERLGIEYFVLGGRRFRDVRFHLSLARILRRVNARVVHTHMFAPLAHSLPALKLAGVPRIVHTEHSFEYLEAKASHRLALRAMSRFAHSFTVVGERMRPFYLDSIGVQSDRLRVIVNGIDVAPLPSSEERLEVRREIGLPSDVVLVAAAGRLAPEKNLGLLLRATASARKKGLPLHLVLIGEGESRSELERMANDLGLDGSVSFLGWRTDVRRILGAVDIYALTSISEGLPLALLEGMAAGLPAVSTAVGDVPLLIRDGSSGFLIGQNDEATLVARLEQLACVPELRDAMGSAARAVVLQTYDRSTMIDRYLEAYGL